MFTGIVTDIGKVLSIERAGVLDVRIGTSYAAGSLDIGASVACDGVCLTVTDVGRATRATWFAVQASEEVPRSRFHVLQDESGPMGTGPANQPGTRPQGW